MTLGLAGAVVALGAEWVLYDAVVEKVQKMDTLQMLHFVPFREMLWMLAAIFAVAGLFVGIVGGWVSIRKFLKV
jgi:cell division protein FtsX